MSDEAHLSVDSESERNVLMTATLAAPVDVHLENAWLVARAADDFKGKEILVLDMQPITPLVDYFVVVTANSVRQMRAMGEEANRIMKLRGRTKAYAEGENAHTQWLLFDYGDVVLHVFTPEGRKLYQLENLWADAPRVEWREPGRPVRNEEDDALYFSSQFGDYDVDQPYNEHDPELDAIAANLDDDEFDEDRIVDQDDEDHGDDDDDLV